MKIKPKDVVISNIIGIVLIIAGVLLNEWVLTFIFSEDSEISLLKRKIIWGFILR